MFTNILIPVDGNPEAEAAIPIAVEIAKKFGAAVLLLEVNPAYGQIMGATAAESFGASGSVQAAAEVAAAAESAAGAYLEALRVRYGTPEWKTVVAEGDSSTAIVEQAKKSGTDLIVMATHARSGLKRLFLGSVAEDVIRHADVPVLVVHSNDQP